MAKWVRLWGKKRGDRMSGWWVVGSVGEAAFFGILFLLGIVSLTIVVSWQVFWPESNIIRPGSGFWLTFTASLAFAVIGLTAFILQVSQTLASPERRSAIATKVKSEHQRRSDSEPAHVNLPNLDEMRESPGIKLAYRLPGQRGENSQLILSALFATAWNSIVAVMLVVVIFQSTSPAGPNYFLIFLLLPFLLVSVVATRWFFKLFRIRTGIGPTAVEINALPMLPGYEYQLYICQYGRVEFSKLSVALVAFEETTFQQGTDVRTEVVEVSRIEANLPASVQSDGEKQGLQESSDSKALPTESPENVSDMPIMPSEVAEAGLGQMGSEQLGQSNQAGREGEQTWAETEVSNSSSEPDSGAGTEVESKDIGSERRKRKDRSGKSAGLRAEPEKPLELDCTLLLPADMMHSFHSEHSALVWRIVIQGESVKWPAFYRSFPVAVYPRSAV